MFRSVVGVARRVQISSICLMISLHGRSKSEYKYWRFGCSRTFTCEWGKTIKHLHNAINASSTPLMVQCRLQPAEWWRYCKSGEKTTMLWIRNWSHSPYQTNWQNFPFNFPRLKSWKICKNYYIHQYQWLLGLYLSHIAFHAKMILKFCRYINTSYSSLIPFILKMLVVLVSCPP